MFEQNDFENGRSGFLQLPSLCCALSPQSSDHALDVFLRDLEVKTQGSDNTAAPHSENILL